MAKTRTVYSTQDDGAGTLRDALRATASYTQEWIDAGALENGDIIDFSDELEDTDGVITIYLESQLSLPAKILTIDGGSHTGSGATLQTRVILDAQGDAENDTWRVMNGPSTSGGSVNINGVTFKNGYHDASGYFGGGFNARNTNENVFNYCVFDSCGARSGAGVYGTTNTINTFNNCLFTNCNAFSSYGGGAYSFNGQMSFNFCHFINNNANAQGGAFYVNSTLNNAFNSCVFNGNTANNGDDLYVSANSLITFSGSQTLTDVTVGAGATVTFSGVDSVLAVTTTATIGSATFTASANSTGYAAFPSETDTSAATFTGVKATAYGANVTSVAASIDEDVATIDVTATDPAIAYLVEGSSDGGASWQTLTLVDKQTALASAKAYKFRTFDGHFVTTDTIPRVYYYNGSANAGSFATAADWTLDEARSIVCSDSPTIAGGVFYCV